jgi:hypothetical protein
LNWVLKNRYGIGLGEGAYTYNPSYVWEWGAEVARRWRIAVPGKSESLFEKLKQKGLGGEGGITQVK